MWNKWEIFPFIYRDLGKLDWFSCNLQVNGYAFVVLGIIMKSFILTYLYYFKYVFIVIIIIAVVQIVLSASNP